MRGGLLIKEARLRAGLTQKALAERLDTSQSVIARWESGRRSPTFETVVRAIRACGLDLHPTLAVRDEQDQALIRQHLRLSPAQRVAVNRRMLETERWTRRARPARSRG